MRVTLPNSVISIGGGAFDTGTTIIQNGQVISGIHDELFYILLNGKITIWDYTGTVKNIRIPDNINGISVTAIGDMAFSDNRLTSVTLPNSVTAIGDYAFLNNHLTSVTIPGSVISIGYGAFARNRLTSVTLPHGVTAIGDWAFDDGVTVIRQ
jgi:hypothetical protein